MTLRIVHVQYRNKTATAVGTGRLTTECGIDLHPNDVTDALLCLSRVTCEACLDYLSDVVHGEDYRAVVKRRAEILREVQCSS